MSVHAESKQRVFASDHSESLRRIYGTARETVGARVAIGGELERRLAIIVLFAYGAEVQLHCAPVGDEDRIAEICAARLLAQTSAA